MGVPASGWYDDPSGSHDARFWDGANWTDRVVRSGVPSNAPVADWPPPRPREPAPLAAAPAPPTPNAPSTAAPQPRGPLAWFTSLETWLQVVLIAVVLTLVIGLVAGTRSSQPDNQYGSTSEFPTNDEIREMTCQQLNDLLNDTGAALGLQPDGDIEVPADLTAAEAARIRRVVTLVGERADELGGCREQPNFRGRR